MNRIHSKLPQTGLYICIFSATVALAQTAVTTSGTTSAGSVPVFGPSSNSSVTNSPISVSGSNVGINAQNGQSSNVNLDVFGIIGDIQLQYYDPVYGIEINNTQVSGWVRELSFASNGSKLGSFGASAWTSSPTSGGLSYLYINAAQGGSPGGNNLPTMAFLPSGNVGIGTTTPSQALEVNGNIKIDGAVQAGTGGILFSGSSTPQTTPWTGVLCGGDYAEDVETKGQKKQYEAGDVLVISGDSGSDVEKSAKPYSAAVAGIYATKPGVVGRRESLAQASDDIPMAMVGIVPTKVTTENGPIRRGDLLVTSGKAGYAMKGTDRSKLVGAVIGKAMGSLESGTGKIEVLVTLQ